MPSPTKVLIDPQVAAYAAKLHPEHRRAIKAALKDLAYGRGDIKALKDSLEGFFRLRVGGYRIVYRTDDAGVIQCLFLEDRSAVYETFQPPA